MCGGADGEQEGEVRESRRECCEHIGRMGASEIWGGRSEIGEATLGEIAPVISAANTYACGGGPGPGTRRGGSTADARASPAPPLREHALRSASLGAAGEGETVAGAEDA